MTLTSLVCICAVFCRPVPLLLYTTAYWCWLCTAWSCMTNGFVGEHLKDLMPFSKIVYICSISDFCFERFWLHPSTEESGGKYVTLTNLDKYFPNHIHSEASCAVKFQSDFLQSRHLLTDSNQWRPLHCKAVPSSSPTSINDIWNATSLTIKKYGCTQFISVTGYLTAQKGDKSYVCIKCTQIELKPRLSFISAWKDQAWNTAFFPQNLEFTALTLKPLYHELQFCSAEGVCFIHQSANKLRCDRQCINRETCGRGTWKEKDTKVWRVTLALLNVFL